MTGQDRYDVTSETSKFNLKSGLNYKTYRRKMSLENEYILDISALRILIIDHDTAKFNLEDQCPETNHRNAV